MNSKQQAIEETERLELLKKYPDGLLGADTVDGITVVTQTWHPDHAPTVEEVIKARGPLRRHRSPDHAPPQARQRPVDLLPPVAQRRPARDAVLRKKLLDACADLEAKIERLTKIK